MSLNLLVKQNQFSPFCPLFLFLQLSGARLHMKLLYKLSHIMEAAHFTYYHTTTGMARTYTKVKSFDKVLFHQFTNNFDLTQVPTQNGKRAGVDSGDNRAGKHPALEQTRPESAKKPLSAPLTAAHNPKVVGSNPAPATKKALKLQDFRAFSSLFSENNLGQKMGQHFDPSADPYGEICS